MKYDQNKTPIALVPPECIISIANVLGYGAKKYGPDNWRSDLNNTSYSRTYSSIQRHLHQFWAGEDNDQESGLSHLAHAATQIMILMIQHQDGVDIDDRWKTKNANNENSKRH